MEMTTIMMIKSSNMTLIDDNEVPAVKPRLYLNKILEKYTKVLLAASYNDAKNYCETYDQSLAAFDGLENEIDQDRFSRKIIFLFVFI